MQENENSPSIPLEEYSYDGSKVDNGNQFGIANVTSTVEPFTPKPTTIIIPFIFLIVFTIIGNIFVMYAITTEKHLKKIQNKLIMSLAFADLMVGVLIMPISVYFEVYKLKWFYGAEFCEMIILLNVLFCSASILHLLAIAIDRYWAVTNIEYAANRKPLKIYILIGSAWVLAIIISSVPVLGWKDDKFYERLEKQLSCNISKDLAYIVFFVCTVFFIPLTLIIFFYWNIFRVARQRFRNKPGTSDISKKTARKEIVELSSVVPKVGTNDYVEKLENKDDSGTSSMSSRGEASNRLQGVFQSSSEHKETVRSKESVEEKRERKTAKVLIIITGAFVCCWVPYFTLYVIAVVMRCATCRLDPAIYSTILWLGYTNSTINPVIYTVFSPDFRNAFKRILSRKTVTRSIN